MEFTNGYGTSRRSGALLERSVLPNWRSRPIETPSWSSHSEWSGRCRSQPHIHRETTRAASRGTCRGVLGARSPPALRGTAVAATASETRRDIACKPVAWTRETNEFTRHLSWRLAEGLPRRWYSGTVKTVHNRQAAAVQRSGWNLWFTSFRSKREEVIGVGGVAGKEANTVQTKTKKEIQEEILCSLLS
jgi:hypothetical protein